MNITENVSYAKELLASGGFTCVVCKDDDIYTSDKTGIAPMLMWLNQQVDLAGFSVADKIVGKAAAMLFVKAKIACVHAVLISQAGKQLLEKYHIPYTYETECEYIVNRMNTGMCPMEATVKDMDDIEEAYVALRRKAAELRAMNMKKKVVIDTDAGVDDAMAIIYLLSNPRIDVQAITVVSGNVPMAQGVLNVLQIVEKTCPADHQVPVYAGCAKPLFKELRVASHVHGHDGMGDCDLVHPTTQPQEKSALDYLSNDLDPQADIIALGPLTNLATVLNTNPEAFADQVIYVMGSSGMGPGNITPYAEYNAWVDAEAFDIVAKSKAKITYFGYDVCCAESRFSRADLAPLKNSTVYGDWYHTAITSAMDHRGMKEDGQMGICDAMAVCAYLHPEFVTHAKATIETVTAYDEHYGQTIFELHENGPVTLVTSVQATEMKKNLVDQLARKAN